MNETIIYKMRSDNRFSAEQVGGRIFFEASSQKAAYIYHIDHVNVDSYIIDHSELSAEEMRSTIEHIRYLNAIITIILYRPVSDLPLYLLNDKYIKTAIDDSEISQCLKEISTVSRDSNRVHWPLNVEYWLPEDKKGTIEKAKVLSLSSSGCFIKTAPLPPHKMGDDLAMVFNFNSFDFYSDGNIVRVSNKSDENQGIAVEFKEVSKQTQRCIGDIIDEKILTEIMDTIK